MAAASKQDPVRSLANRIFLMISGRWFRAYSIVRHVGRTSGRAYQNPVSAYPLGDGFVIPVLYGTQSQWVRNVMAAGHFTLRTKGRDYRLERPELISPAQALAAYPALLRGIMQLQQTQAFVWAHRGRADEADSEQPPCRVGHYGPRSDRRLSRLELSRSTATMATPAAATSSRATAAPATGMTAGPSTACARTRAAPRAPTAVANLCLPNMVPSFGGA